MATLTLSATAHDTDSGLAAHTTRIFAVNSLLVGSTIPNLAMQPGAYDANLTQDQADTKFCQIVNRGIGSGSHLAVTKKFWNLSDYSLTKNNLAAYARYGTTVIFAMWPALPGTAAENAKLATFLAGVKKLGFSAANAFVVLWQEPEVASKNITAAMFQAGLQFYGPTVAAAGFPLVADIGSGAGLATLTSYGNAAVAALAAGAPVTGLAQDIYCPSYTAGGIRLTTLAGIANNAHLPYGVFEHGCVPSQFTVAQATAYLTHIHDFMLTRLQAGLPCLPVLYYDGQGSPTGKGDITSPIGQDPSTPAPDFRIALFQRLYDDLCGLLAGRLRHHEPVVLWHVIQPEVRRVDPLWCGAVDLGQHGEDRVTGGVAVDLDVQARMVVTERHLRAVQDVELTTLGVDLDEVGDTVGAREVIHRDARYLAPLVHAAPAQVAVG